MSSTDLVRSGDPLAVAKILYESKLFTDTKSEAQAVVKVLAGQEYGLAPFAAMRGIHIIQGQPVPGAHVLAQAIKRSGHYTFKVLAHTLDKCSLEFFQKAPGGWESLGVETFTLDDAKRAGLLGKQNWQKHPRNMLFARAVANGARFHCPDITGGPVLVVEELEDGGDAPPVTVTNQADAKPSPEGIEALHGLYLTSGLRTEDAEDPDAPMRLLLASHGAGNSGDIKACISDLTRAQFEGIARAIQDSMGATA